MKRLFTTSLIVAATLGLYCSAAHAQSALTDSEDMNANAGACRDLVLATDPQRPSPFTSPEKAQETFTKVVSWIADLKALADRPCFSEAERASIKNRIDECEGAMRNAKLLS